MQKKDAIKMEKLKKNLHTIKNANLLPCIVFCFAKAHCLEMATFLDSTFDFTTGEEKGKIKKFLKE